MTAEGFLGQLFVTIGVDTSGLANAATEMNTFQQKVITTSKMVNASTAQAANISDARLKQSYNAESQYISNRINNARQWDSAQAKASRQYGSYIKQQITDSKQWETHQAKWRGVEENYYRQEATSQNKRLSSYNAAQKLANSQESQYYRQQAQEAAAAEKAVSKANAGMAISYNSLSNNLYRFGTFASMAFTLPLTALAVLATKSAIELEQIKQKTVALANVSQEQMDAWSGAITRIGIATNATSKAIAQSLYFVSSAGVDNANAMKMVEFAAKGTAAGLGETDVIAKLLTYTYNAYGKEAFDVVKIMDSLTVAVREGAAEATDFSTVMGDLVPIGAQLGVSFAQLAGSLAAMTQIGMNAHKSATALRQIMIQLIHPHHDAAAALDKAAIKMGDVSIASRNLTATINNKGLLETMVKIKEAGEKMGPMFLPTVFSNVRAFTGVMAEVGPNLEKVREIMRRTTTETGAFENALRIMTQTSEFKFGQFKKAWELSMLSLGQTILPTLIPMLHSLTETLNDLSVWFKSLSESTQTLVLKFGVFLALLGPITIALSGMVRLWAILGMSMTGLIIPAVHALGTAFIFLSEALLTAEAILPGFQVMLGATILATALYSILTATKELTVAQKAVNDVNTQATQSIVAEKVAIDQLMKVATNSNASLEQKQRAIKTINAINPEYLEGINQETIRTGEATAAIERYLKSLELKAKKEAAYAALVEVEKKRAIALASGSDKELTFQQKALNWYEPERKFIAADNAKQAAKDYTETVQKLNDVLNEVPIELQRVELASVRVAKTLSIFPVKKSIADPVTYYTTKQYIDDMVSGMTKFNLIVNNSKPGKILPFVDAEESDKLEKAIKDIQDTFLDSLAKIRAMKAMYGAEIDYSGLKFNEQEELLKAYGSAIEGLAGKMDKSTPYYVKLRKEFEALAVAQRTAAMSLSYMNLDETTTNIGNKPLSARGGKVQMTDTSVYLKRIDETLTQYKIDSNVALLMNQALGSSFDLNGEKIKLNDTLIKDLSKIYVSATGNAAAMAIAQEHINAAMQTNVILTTKDIMDQYSNAIEKNTAQYNKSGNIRRRYIANLQAEIEQTKALMAIVGISKTRYADLADQLERLEMLVAKPSAFQKFNDAFQQIGQQVNNLITSYTDYVKIKQNAAYEMIDNIAKKEGKSAEWVAKKKAQLDAQYGNEFKNMAIAQALINGAMGITAVWANPAYVAAPYLGAIMTAFIAANTAAQIATISAQKMAGGGIVPSGYSNDTYPALLSSGEAVIPPHKLSSMIGSGKQTIYIKGKLTGSGRDLLYIIDQEVEVMKSF